MARPRQAAPQDTRADPRPAPSGPPRKKRHWGRWILAALAALALLIVIIAVATSGGGGGSGNSPGTGGAARNVTYVVTGSPAEVTYGPAGSSLSGTVPMNKTTSIGNPAYYALSAQLQGSGSVTCTLEVDGRTVSEATASGSFQIAMCQIHKDPVSGQWKNTNESG